MVSLNLNNGSVAFTGLEGTVVLLDSEKPLENKSRVSMRRFSGSKRKRLILQFPLGCWMRC